MSQKTIILPEPLTKGLVSLEETIAKRRSIRHFSREFLTLQELSQLLWAGNGISRGNFYHTYPSAGALYPIEIYVVAQNVHKLQEGMFHYVPHKHCIELIKPGRFLYRLSEVSYGQSAINECSVAFIITVVLSRSLKKYGDRAERYVQIEVGHVGQNILLQAVALGLGAVPMGAFIDDGLRDEFRMEGDPYYIIPVGRL